MKRVVCFVCLLALFLCSCAVVEQTTTVLEENDTYGIYQLIFQTDLISNDCVGRDWLFTYTYNGQTIESGYTITQPLEESTFESITVEVREQDKIDDVGTGVLGVVICDGGFDKIKVTVTETSGRYKGNIAVWEIICEVKLIGKK